MYMPTPTTEVWKQAERGYRYRWNFPNCVGAIDGKHVIMHAPSNSGSLYRNYKYSFSMVLMAIVDPWKRFTAIEVGDIGSNCDGAIFQNCLMGRRICAGKFGFPEDKALPGMEDRGKVAHCIVADEAFPLRSNVMRPFPGRKKNTLTDDEKLFNYRMSRPRLTSENTFGGTVQTFRIFHRKIYLNPDSTRDVVYATCVLHNYLTKVDTSFLQQMPDEEPLVNLDEYEAVARIPANTARNPALDAVSCRNLFVEYFKSPQGIVPWQYRCANIPEPNQQAQ
jgi:hypothetical protein